MKKSFLIIALAITTITAVHSQKWSSQTFIQQTVMGLQKGYGVRLQNDRGIGLGVLFQSNGKLSIENGNNNYPFYGIEAIIPLTKCGKTTFMLTPKGGFVNKNFFVLIPEVETKIQISKRFSASIMAGIRSRESSVGAKWIINLN